MSIPTLETPYAGEWPWICIHRPTQPPFMDCAFPRFGLNDGCVAGHRSVAIASERAAAFSTAVSTHVSTGSVLVSILSSASSQRRSRSCWPPCLALVLAGLGDIAENTSFIAAVRDPEYPSVTLGPSPLSLDFSDFQ